MLSGQKDLQKKILDMMQNMTRQHEYDNLMRDIAIYDVINMDLADWLLQIEKVAILTNTQQYELAMAKSTGTPYQMLNRMKNGLSWQEIKWKLEEVYLPIATEVHAASDLCERPKISTHNTKYKQNRFYNLIQVSSSKIVNMHTK